MAGERDKLSKLQESYQLSPLQQGMLFHHLYAPGSGVDIGQMILELREPLNGPAFKQAWQQLTDRHPVLRTSFRWANLAEPRQDVYDQLNIPISEHDWRGISAQEQANRLEAHLRLDRQLGFDPTRAPLHRLAIFRLSDTNFNCLWTFHHILLDGHSFLIVLQELFLFYEALCTGQPLDLRRPRRYGDYIEWLQQQDWTRAKEFWTQALRGFTDPTPLVVDQPASSSATPRTSYGVQETKLPAAVTSALGVLARTHQLTLNTFFQGAWAILLSRYSGAEDILFGTTRACRHAVMEGAENVVGLFINTVPVRVHVSTELALLPWLKQLRSEHLALREYEHTPLIKIQEWSELPGGTPLFESVLVFNNYDLAARLKAQGGPWQKRNIRLIGQTNYPLTVTGYDDTEILLSISYNQQRFQDAAMARLLGHFKTLLESMATHPEQRLAELPLLTETERQQLLTGWNQPAYNYSPQPKPCIHQLFEVQVEKNPDSIAVVFPATPLLAEIGNREKDQLTYRQLNRRANQLAHYLQNLGIGPECLVVIYLERSIELMVAILGILKAGAAYVPVEPTLPQERVALVLADTRASVLLTESQLVSKLPPSQAHLVCLDTDWQRIAQQPAANPASPVTPDNLAYAIYTSGSTGKPKAVLVSHYNVTRLFDVTQPLFHFDETDVWTLFHSYAFDFSVWEMWGALLFGGRLVIVSYWLSRSPDLFYHLLNSEQVTILNQTPSAFRQLMQIDQAMGRRPDFALRLIILGGEALSLASLKPWFERHGDRQPQVINMYGITETTVHVTYRPVTLADLDQAPASLIGVPLADLQLFVLDQNRQPVPIGIPGELYVAGPGVTRGYLNKPELTAERFVPDPLSSLPAGCLYRSGDLVRWLPDRELEYLGRIDHQIKIRGYRVELGEIEAWLNSHPAVSQSVVVAKDSRGQPGQKQLVAYIVLQPGNSLREGELRQYLSSKLPDYMLPAIFVTLAELPLTANGKLDRRSLPPPPSDRPESGNASLLPRQPLECQLAKVWEQVLAVTPIGIRDNFFELGGDSLSTVQLAVQIEKQLGLSLPLAAIFQAPTIEQMADLLHQAGWSTSNSSKITPFLPDQLLVPITPGNPGNSRPPFFCLAGNLGNVHTDLGNLARYLGSDQPFYGLQDGLECPIRIGSLARRYIGAMRKVQPEGPYLLGGVCLGGVVAFEMAQQLRAEGQKVAALALIEPPYLPISGFRAYFDFASYVLGHGLHRFRHHADNFLWRVPAERKVYVRLKLKLIANMWAVTCYKPKIYQGRFALFVARESLERPPFNACLNWQELATDDVELHVVPGSHESLTRVHDAGPDYSQLRFLANQLRQHLDHALPVGFGKIF